MAARLKNKICFVVGPIGSRGSEQRVHADLLLEKILEPVVNRLPGFRIERADKIASPGLIDAQIINILLTAELCIADLTFLNPNAFYEIGIRHMVQKPTIHVHRTGTNIPFDLSLYRSIEFSTQRPSDIKAARSRLRQSASRAIEIGHEIQNPVTSVLRGTPIDLTVAADLRLMLLDMRSLWLEAARRKLFQRDGHIIEQRWVMSNVPPRHIRVAVLVNPEIESMPTRAQLSELCRTRLGTASFNYREGVFQTAVELNETNLQRVLAFAPEVRKLPHVTAVKFKVYYSVPPFFEEQLDWYADER